MTNKQQATRYITVPKEMFSELNFEIHVPTFRCACGEEVLDTPSNRLRSYLIEQDHE